MNGDPGFRTFTLDNGMTVNMIVNRSAPLAEVHLYVRTGYAWEPDALQGVSHVVEHNLMHGSPKRPHREDFARDRRSMGAWYDAGTTYDYTEYLMIVPSRHFREGLDMLADGFFSPVFTQEVFDSEMGAILQESNRKKDIPEPMVLEKLYSTAYKVDHKRRWRLGTEESLGRITLEDLKTYFVDRYGPGNVACTVGGDIDLDHAEAWVREAFGAIPAADVKGETSPVEPPQDGVRYLEIPTGLGRVYWIAGFHTPSFMVDEGFHCYDLLAGVLGGGRGSRLISRIQEKGLVDRIEARSAEFDEYMLFNVYAETDPERLAEAEEAILSEIFALGLHEIAPQELRRARTVVEAQVLERQDDIRRHVEWLAMCEGRGGSVKRAGQFAELLSVATPGDLRRAAEACLTPSNLSVCMLRPKEQPARDIADIEARAETAYKKAKEITAILSTGSESGIEVPAAIATSILEKPTAPVLETLDNGVKVVHEPNPGNPTFALAALLRGGRSLETPDQCGITDLALGSLLKGTQEKPATVVAKALEDLGVHLAPVMTDDAYGFTLYGPRAAFTPASEILAEILKEPAFDSVDVVAEAKRMGGRIRGLADRPREFSLDRFRREIFAGHAYGLPRPGDLEALDRLDAPSVAAWHGNNLTGRNMVISVAGDLDTAEITTQMNRLYESLPAGEPRTPADFDLSALTVPREVKVTHEGSQTTTVAGFPMPSATSEDLHTLDLIAYFCQGDGGRFYDEIRGKRGLAYVVHALNVPRLSGGYFLGFSATAHDKAAEARSIFLREFTRLYEAPPTDEELARTKEFCLGMRLVRQRRTSLSRALALATTEILGQGVQFEADYESRLRAVTLDQFVDTAKRHFPEGKHVVVTVGQ